MHRNLPRQNLETENKYVLVEIVSLIIEGRLLNTAATNAQNDQSIHREKTKKFIDGPHIALHSKSLNRANVHVCDLNNLSCKKYKDVEQRLLWLCKLQIPMCIEVLITSDESDDELCPLTSTPVQNLNQKTVFLFERWNISFRECINDGKKGKCMATFGLLNAIRSQMYFSQLSSWLLSSDDAVSDFFKNKKLKYRISLPGETYNPLSFTLPSDVHSFPALPISDKSELLVVLSSLNRSNKFETFQKVFNETVTSESKSCSTIAVRDQTPGPSALLASIFANYQSNANTDNSAGPSNQSDSDKLLAINEKNGDESEQNKGSAGLALVQRASSMGHLLKLRRVCRKIQFTCDNRNRAGIISFDSPDILNTKSNRNSSSVAEWVKGALARYISAICLSSERRLANLTFLVPSNLEKSVFQTSLKSASDMIYGHKSGLMFIDRLPRLLPKSEDLAVDSEIGSKNSSEKDNEEDEEEENEKTGRKAANRSRGNVKEKLGLSKAFQQSSVKKLISFRLRRSQSLLGSYEESVLNGRISPVSIVNGYRADILISSRRRSYTAFLPVTVFFYTLSDSFIKDSSFLGHINMTKNELAVPKKGTLCCTLVNPMGTVVKMFVIMYDLSDMPPKSRTFLRQKTFKIPSNFNGHESELKRKWLQYLIHLKFMSSKSGQIYLHSDIRLIVFQKAHLDAAIDLCSTTSYEYRSFISGPNNPKYSLFRF